MALVLIIGGSGRIGSSIARDVLNYTQADVAIAGRNVSRGEAALAHLGSRVKFRVVDFNHPEQIQQAVAEADLAIDTAGPFYHRKMDVLQACIDRQVNYLDVSDERSFTIRALALRPAAEAAGITAIINTGVFPGISNSMVRQGVEKLDRPDSIHLSYVVAGSGGAGVTVMRTTFIGLQRPFEAWLDGRWQEVKPYTERETIEFPPPYGRAQVYWYDMPEAFTLAAAFPVKQVITKFGIVPDFYNHLTWIAARFFPPPMLKSPATVEFLARVSHQMTQVTDRFSGQGVAVRSEVCGQKDGQPACYRSTFFHESAAVATGCGTGSIAQLMLEGKLHRSGVWSVEQVLSTELFDRVMQQRQLQIPGQMIYQ
ncbi:MAG: saccharopine dehydrogenase NADP-binding domain-containing protein [Cyanosarcina radialis HA8281-LM2]|nr:saccharopine dehydrogenase NADP-binding domain-containing protein [Cyanosarcina radialis HA8281-LM2]